MKRIWILHEGSAKKTADNRLIYLLLEHMQLDVKKVEFYGMGAKSNFFKKEKENYPSLMVNAADKVLLIVDADYQKNDQIYGGFSNTRKKLLKIIRELGLQGKCRRHIMCDPATKDGYLESFILSTIPKQQKQCIEQFLSCSNFKSKDNHKAILNQIYDMAYPNAPYDFSHPHFDKLKSKLNALFDTF